MIKKLVSGFIKEQVQKRGSIIIAHTPKESVVSLIDKLHPYSIDKELIRLGPNGDGGYLVPDDLVGIEACFSPGVDQISEFEADCLKRGMQIFLADKSVDKPKLNLASDKYNFLKKHIGITNNEDFITMDEWVKSGRLDEKSDLLLQMDIEGGEYFSLINISDSLIKRFRIMVIEFHDFWHFWDPHFYGLAEAVFDKILQTHTCVHIHPNNCCEINDQYDVELPLVAEFTFIRNDRINSKNYQTNFPHKLDYDNTGYAHISLPKNWYKH